MGGASIPTILHVMNEKTVGNLPLLPYSSLIANAFSWNLYGIMKREPKVWSCNSIGLALGLWYFATFTKYCPTQAPTLPGSISQHITGCLSIISLVALIGLSPNILVQGDKNKKKLATQKAANIIGNIAVGICITLFASPLSALKTVLETKSAVAIPLPFTIATLVNCFLWTTLGIFDMKDVNIYLPNVLGLICATLQLI